jgi:MSHA pilin protein MshC
MKLHDRGFSRGFTLVELVLVLTIAGVLAAVAVPRMVDRSAFQTHGGAAEIRTALRYAQKLALAKNREVCVTTTATNLTLMFTDTPGPACGQIVVRPDGDTSNPTYTVTLPNGINLTPVMTFRFDAQGRPNPNVAVNLMVGGSAPVMVNPGTGYVQ